MKLKDMLKKIKLGEKKYLLKKQIGYSGYSYVKCEMPAQ
jgi:hypothetical protein